MKTKIFNMNLNKYEIELLFEEKKMKFLFETKIGRFLVKHALSKKCFSQLYGAQYSKPKSISKISDFIKKYEIDMSQFEESDYKNFNDFFIRKFAKNKRQFPTHLTNLGAPCEGRYFGYEKNTQSNFFPVKGSQLNSEQLLGFSDSGIKWAPEFTNGPILIARLAPIDYHRFHYFDDGEVLDQFSLGKDLFSVNPVSAKNFDDLYLKNHRCVNILQTQNFGLIAYIEVGALCVGKIVHSNQSRFFKRGEEKGYFLFGGSSIVILGQKNKWDPCERIQKETVNGYETLIQLGVTLANAP